jgi:glutamate formiminotransferase
VAYNVNLKTSDLALAKRIARTVRESSGGLPAVQALGMATDDPSVVQVSMNLLDTATTPLHVVFETVQAQAGAAGVAVVESEIVGLLPLDVVVAATRTHIKARRLETDQIVEARLLQTLRAAEPPLGA